MTYSHILGDSVTVVYPPFPLRGGTIADTVGGGQSAPHWPVFPRQPYTGARVVNSKPVPRGHPGKEKSMTTFTVGESELETIIAALRLLRHTSVLSDLTPELSKAITPMVVGDIMTSLKPAQIDDLIERLKPV